MKLEKANIPKNKEIETGVKRKEKVNGKWCSIEVVEINLLESGHLMIREIISELPKSEIPVEEGEIIV